MLFPALGAVLLVWIFVLAHLEDAAAPRAYIGPIVGWLAYVLLSGIAVALGQDLFLDVALEAFRSLNKWTGSPPPSLIIACVFPLIVLTVKRFRHGIKEMRRYWQKDLTDTAIAAVITWSLIYAYHVRKAMGARLTTLPAIVSTRKHIDPPLGWEHPPQATAGRSPTNQIAILDVSLVNPSAPKLVIRNASNRTADGVIWRLTMFRTTDFRLFSYAEQHIGFIKAQIPVLPILIEPNQLAHGPTTEVVREGDPFIGTLSVDCPTCRGVMLAVYFVWQKSGWFNLLPITKGEVLLPKNAEIDSVKEYINALQHFNPAGQKSIH